MLSALVATQLGAARAAILVDGLVVQAPLPGAGGGDPVPRAVIAQALAVVLLDDLLQRVPSAAAYAEGQWAAGGRLVLDHARVRTVTGVACGELPPGRESVARLLRPLGYTPADAGGSAWRHLDRPAEVARYLVDELPADAFSDEFRAAAARVVRSSHDPLTGLAQVHLDRLAVDRHLPRKAAESLLGELVACFARHHGAPALADYEILLAESEEMAWIATEGTSWHHASVVVDDPVASPPEPATVERSFTVGERATVTRTVPGSHLELVPPSPFGTRDGVSGLRRDRVVQHQEGQAEDPEGVVGP